jgi:hypothetical protein
VVPDANAAGIDDSGQIVVGAGLDVIALDADGKERWRATLPSGRVLDVAVSGAGRWVAAGSSDHT